jgi:hypothetical protein
MTDYYPYSINGGGGLAPAASPSRDAYDSDGDNEGDIRRINDAADEYLNTGHVTNPQCAAFLRTMFPRITFPLVSSPMFGAQPTSEPSHDTMGVLPATIMPALNRSIRIATKSVYPGPDALGSTLRDFLDEIARTIPEFRFKYDDREEERKAALKKRQKSKLPINTPVGGANRGDNSDGESDNQDDPNAATSGRAGRSLNDISEWYNVFVRVSLYAPWSPASTLNPNIKKTGKQVQQDLTIRKSVFDAYVHAYRSSRTVMLMTDLYDHPDLVTLVLESEADVWAACGGSATRLPRNTWITNRIRALKEVDPLGNVYNSSAEDAVHNFLQTEHSACVNLKNAYVGDQSTIESEIYKFLQAAPGSVSLASEKSTIFVNAYLKWLHDEKITVPLTMIDVLRKGHLQTHDPGADGEFEDKLREDADRLVFVATLNGYVGGDGTNIMNQLLFQNAYPDANMTYEIDPAVISVPPNIDTKTDALLVNQFRRGKEVVVKEATLALTQHEGGERALLVTHPEYRRHFITLCRANYQLRKLSGNVSVVTDRRRRVADQEYAKRESLYFFQSRNGNATQISSHFIT